MLLVFPSKKAHWYFKTKSKLALKFLQFNRCYTAVFLAPTKVYKMWTKEKKICTSWNRRQGIYKNLFNIGMVFSKPVVFFKVKYWYQLNIQFSDRKWFIVFIIYFFMNVLFIRLTIYFRKTFGSFSPNISNVSFWVFQNDVSIIRVHEDNCYLVWLNIEQIV